LLSARECLLSLPLLAVLDYVMESGVELFAQAFFCNVY